MRVLFPVCDSDPYSDINITVSRHPAVFTIYGWRVSEPLCLAPAVVSAGESCSTYIVAHHTDTQISIPEIIPQQICGNPRNPIFWLKSCFLWKLVPWTYESVNLLFTRSVLEFTWGLKLCEAMSSWCALFAHEPQNQNLQMTFLSFPSLSGESQTCVVSCLRDVRFCDIKRNSEMFQSHSLFSVWFPSWTLLFGLVEAWLQRPDSTYLQQAPTVTTSPFPQHQRPSGLFRKALRAMKEKNRVWLPRLWPRFNAHHRSCEEVSANAMVAEHQSESWGQRHRRNTKWDCIPPG